MKSQHHLTLQEFSEKMMNLQIIFDKNREEMTQQFLKKTKRLMNQLSESDRALLRKTAEEAENHSDHTTTRSASASPDNNV